MKNKLLLSSLLSLSILTFSGTAKAQESADATFTGTLSASTEVVKFQDGSGTIDPVEGFLTDIFLPIFSVTTSEANGVSGIFASAPVSGSPTLGLNEGEGIVFIALTNGTPSGLAVSNAISESPNVQDNPDVIAYDIRVTPGGQPEFVFNEGVLEGVILDSPGSTNILVTILPESRPDTFGTNDSAGDYTANFTLTAVSSL